jgi:hypothetical protein
MRRRALLIFCILIAGPARAQQAGVTVEGGQVVKASRSMDTSGAHDKAGLRLRAPDSKLTLRGAASAPLPGASVSAQKTVDLGKLLKHKTTKLTSAARPDKAPPPHRAEVKTPPISVTQSPPSLPGARSEPPSPQRPAAAPASAALETHNSAPLAPFMATAGVAALLALGWLGMKTGALEAAHQAVRRWRRPKVHVEGRAGSVSVGAPEFDDRDHAAGFAVVVRPGATHAHLSFDEGEG